MLKLIVIALTITLSCLVMTGCDSKHETMEVDGWTPLHSACESGDVEMVKLRLRQKEGINATSTVQVCIRDWPSETTYAKGITPLAVAAAAGHKDVVEILVDKGADINAGSVTAVSAAIKGGNSEIAELLRGKGGHE